MVRERVGASCGTLSGRVLSCYLYDSGLGEGVRGVGRRESGGEGKESIR